MKLKRRAVTAKYADDIESLYAAVDEPAYADSATRPAAARPPRPEGNTLGSQDDRSSG